MAKTEKPQALILFARDPVIGQVKTRLQGALAAEVVFKLYSGFLEDSIDKICAVEDTDLFIGAYPSPESEFFTELQPRVPIRVFSQEGADLGERMKNVFLQRIAEGYHRTVIIGSDSPSLPVEYIRKAFASEKELVLGPSTDGGYYLIGMGSRFVDVFSGVSWGSATVLGDTLTRIREGGVSLETLPVWYDVDLPEDLRFLKTHLELMAEAGLENRGVTGDFLKGLDW